MAMIDFKKEFERVLKEEEVTYEPKGIITASGKIYPLGTDTKVLSSVFEMLVKPTIYRVARENNLMVREAHAQNYYPDFTLMSDESDPQKIAVDIKTTYRKRPNQKVKFTLGSYTSFIRPDNDTKNIEFPYSEYVQHWIVGFIYTRQAAQEGGANVYDSSQLAEIPTPFSEVTMFVAEKWRIAGDKAGSGNTANIGSITGQFVDFCNEAGLFNSEEEFLEYWRHYGRTASERKSRYSNLSEFRMWKKGEAKS